MRFWSSIVSLLMVATLFVACEGGDNGLSNQSGHEGSRVDSNDTSLPCVVTDVEYVYPGKEWEHTTFEECGFEDCSATIKSVYGAHTSLCIVVGGKIMYESGDDASLYYLASSRKSLLSMLYGIGVDRGIVDLNLTIGELIEQGIIKEDIDEGDIKGLLDIEKTATIEHCIMSRSGVYHQASNSGSTLDTPSKVPARGSKEPGSYYLYSNWDFNVAGAILDGIMGESVFDMFERELAQPLQFEAWDRTKHSYGGDTSKSIYKCYHFKLVVRDMARLGYLMLRKGKWAYDDQIISEEWVAKSTSILSTREETGNDYFGYGYMWWVLDDEEEPEALQGTYSASGAGGQFIMVVPGLDMVIAVKRDDTVTGSWSLNKTYNLAKLLCNRRLQ